MIGFLIWSIAAGIFLVIGIKSRKSKKAVNFWANRKVPGVADVKKYNHAVAILWFVSAVILELIGITFLFLKQNSPLFLLVILAVVFLVIGMAVAYTRIESKYRQ